LLTFDRYLLRSFWHTFAVCFATLFGLVVVIDLFENLDEFILRNEDQGLVRLLERIGWYYGYQSILFLDKAGPALTIISVAVVLILFQRSGEFYPLLAAGVSMRRVLFPLIIATFGLNFLLVMNQELIVPRFADAAATGRGVSSQNAPGVEAAYDHATRIQIHGKKLIPAKRTVEHAEFVLPAPDLVRELTILKAEKAIFRRGRGDRPTGWYLKQTEPAFADLPLTERGAMFLHDAPQVDGVFVATDLTPDQLYKRTTSYAMLSSSELLRRIRNPAFGMVSAHRLVLHLHTRLVQPLLNLIAVLITIPLMVRRESVSLVVDAGLCAGLQGVMFGVLQLCQFLGGNLIIAPDLAAWLPVIICGSIAAAVGGLLRT
jgi:lipopolysaccharide export system permease protein